MPAPRFQHSTPGERTINQTPAAPRSKSAAELFEAHQQSIFVRTDRLFAALMMFQWLAGIAAALWISPRAWEGLSSSIHPHVWAAVFLGGAISALPIALALLRPGHASTRYVIATGQALTSALLIHLTGGRIETHFHVFGSLAILATYRDWRVLIPATLVVATDHLLRGIFMPESVYGVLAASPWRWLEHAGWVVFEDIFLLMACFRGEREMWRIAERTADLNTSEERYRAVVEQTAEGLCLLDPAGGTVIESNAAFRNLLGYTAGEIAGLPLEKFEAGPAVLPAAGAPPATRDARYLRKDGSVLDVSIHASTISFGGRDVLCHVVNDITERKRAQEDLHRAKEAAEAASRAKGDFLANMSHEIRTPLNGVIGITELLLGTELTERQKRQAHLVKTSADSLLVLINDILDFSKIEAGKLELESADFDLRVLVEDVAEMLAQKAAAKGIELGYQIDPAVPRQVRGDSGRLKQVLMNLVNNAIKFTHEGEVVVRVTPLDGGDARGGRATVKFAVTDSGIGIAPDSMDRLFKSFSQVDTSTTRKYGGTGLGLVISKQIVDVMGGRIGAESTPGKGSTFWFTAPLDANAAAATPHAPIDLRGMRALAVDDNATAREILHDQLTTLKLDAHTAVDGPAALQALRSAAAEGRPFRVAIIDLVMPGIHGLEVGKLIKSDPAIRETIVITLSAIQSQPDAAAIQGLGFFGHLTKPLRQSQLFDMLIGAVAGAATATGGDAKPLPAKAALTPAPGAPEHPARILVAEDNEVNQIVVREILAQSGYRCEIVNNGRKAADAALAGGFDMVLMDCQMPDMDGFEATRLIRAREQERGGGRVTIVAVTASAVKGDQERCLAAGMDRYLTKPLDPRLLIATVESILNPEAPPAPAPSLARIDETAGTPPIQFDALFDRCMQNADVLGKILGAFEPHAQRSLETIEQSLAEGNAVQVSRSAHALKGSAANLSAEPVREIAARLEKLAAGADELAGIKGDVDRLRAELKRCIAYIPEVLEKAHAR